MINNDIRPVKSVVMTDHPSWLTGAEVKHRCWKLPDDRIQEAHITLEGVWANGSPSDDVPQVVGGVDAYGPGGNGQEENLVVYRWATTDLWDAVAAGIVRQVIRADQARKLFTTAAKELGDELGTGFRSFPSAEKILALPSQKFIDCGLAFQIPKLRTAAEWFQSRDVTTSELEVLSKELGSISGIGPWSVGVILSDISNDFSWYPYDDLAVRRGAQRLWPQHGFSDAPGSFARQWEEFADGHLAALTAVALSGSSPVR